MEELNVVRLSPLRLNGPVPAKSTLSGRSTPRGGSPSFRRLNSGRTPRRDGKSSAFGSQWFRSNRILLWLLLITLWAYGGFYVQSRWAHGDNKEGIFGGSGGDVANGTSQPEEKNQRILVANEESLAVKPPSNKTQGNSMDLDVVLAKQGISVVSDKVSSFKKKSKKSTRASRRKTRGKKKVVAEVKNDDIEVQEEEIPKRNTTYGLLVGPFGSIEDKILEWSPEKRSGTCDRKSQFARLVWSRKFVLILHELSMTGAPLAMLELATELLSCGATVYVVPLSKRGGLMSELSRRKIKVLEDKSDLSFKTAMKADLIIAGSAVCASWIEQYAARTVLGSSQITWWIMENRREYFDRAKLAFNRVKKLIFLSESQSKRWLAWCEEEHIKLKTQPALVPLSISDELAFVAGIPCSLSTPLFSPEKMLEKRQLLRDFVRKEMGLTDNDMLVMSLSSINPGKGQFLLLETTRLLIEGAPPLNGSAVKRREYQKRTLLYNWKQFGEWKKESSTLSNNPQTEALQVPQLFIKGVNYTAGIENDRGTRKLFSLTEGKQGEKLKVLIGSVGSKSNKVPYVKALLNFLNQHSNLSNTVLWTPSTTRVAALYAAADAYVMNSQGLGETFGRVTIEAMAFGLPLLGTDAGGTKEIVEHNVTGLLHSLGRPGTQNLANNLQYLLNNPSERQRLGSNGRKKVKDMYLKMHMYKRFGEVLYDCMRIE
ncbi:hypothetical protein MTR67_015681 [Solanum verrucosum]|uniref:Glycosyl transferase family 1 domain-containing protein n=1 Tax=Solanum verrucosum TaxID=315347 RepID=A0AAF0TK50_SOLVR|nr:hypothetical protein MTR67_015681 [Solanum verrucosum]